MSASADSPQPPRWSSDYFQDGTPSRQPPGRGLIGHVPIVAILLIVQGALEIFFALFCFAFVAAVYLVPQPDLVALRGVGIMIAAVSVPTFLVGALRIVAGMFNLRYRRRVLGIVALGAGLVTMLTAYCAPTSIALAIYGLIVYLNEPVILAFALGDSGRTPAEIRGAFAPR